MAGISSWLVVLGVLAMVAAGLFALWCFWTAGRLDRMHLRLELARASLEALLQHRASVAMELAVAGLPDPASSLLLMEAAREARESDGTGWARWLAESDLTAALMALDLPAVTDEPLMDELVGAARKAGTARRIHNDIAATTRRLHERRRVRWFHLAGHAAWPEMVDFDDRSDFAPPPPPSAQGSDV